MSQCINNSHSTSKSRNVYKLKAVAQDYGVSDFGVESLHPLVVEVHLDLLQAPSQALAHLHGRASYASGSQRGCNRNLELE